MPIPTIQLAGKEVGRVGYGLMSFTWTANPVPDDKAFPAMKAAVDAGANSWATATFYGIPPDQDGGFDNLRLIGRFLKAYPEYIGKVQLVVKGGVTTGFAPSDDLDVNRELIRKAKECLGGNVPIDVYLPARIPPGTDVVAWFKNFDTLRQEGLFTALGASEISLKSLKAVSEHVKISLIENEVSLWSYSQDIRDVIEWCNETKTPHYCYSPLGRGFLTRQWNKPEDIPEGSMQAGMPRFQGEAFYHNIKLVDVVEEIAKRKGVSNAQLAIAWILSVSRYTIPIPGSTNAERAKANTEAANITLTQEEAKELDDILAKFEPQGGRYAPHLAVLEMN